MVVPEEVGAEGGTVRDGSETYFGGEFPIAPGRAEEGRRVFGLEQLDQRLLGSHQARIGVFHAQIMALWYTEGKPDSGAETVYPRTWNAEPYSSQPFWPPQLFT